MRTRIVLAVLVTAVSSLTACSRVDGLSTGGDPPASGGDLAEPPAGAPGDDAASAAADMSRSDGTPGGGDDAGAPAMGCASPSWPAGTETTVMLAQGSTMRSYRLHVGKQVTAGTRVPLLVNFHGLNNSPTIQEGFSGMNAIADTMGFVVAYPQGIQSSFNAGGCCGQAAQDGVDDVGFTRAIVADLETRLCIDARRVYATGFSNGGFMSHRLGCEAADLFAAIAPVSGANGSPTCKPGRAVPVIEFHGDSDTVVQYSSGQTSAKDWAARNGCPGSPQRTAYGSSYCDRWSGCSDGTSVWFCTIAGGQHLWPGASSSIPASPMIWSFLSQYKLP